ncbi:MAG: hypothetical protein KKB45_13105 [Gammaproteobacteria bacterium]|nr:hypothetical protein [Gammaproteobacteria bacterium]
MFRPYIFALSTLFLAVSSDLAASDWTKAKNDFQTAVGVNQTNNLYNTADTTESAQYLLLNLRYDWLSLYEGFGVYLPATITSRHYRDHSALNDQDYQFAPAVKLFLAEAADVTFESQFRRQQLIAGNGSAEFLDPAIHSNIRSEQQRFAIALQLGRQPDRQNVALRLGTERNRLESQIVLNPLQTDRELNQLDSKFLGLDYSHRVSENSAILLNAEIRKEQQLEVDTELQQVGGGFLQQWSGAQQLRVVAGYFQRDSRGVKSSGSFWNVDNLWQVSEAWQLILSSHRLSVLSYANNSVSQLDTLYQAQLQYALSESHRIKLLVGRRSSQLDEQLLHRKRSELTVGWDWHINQQWQSQLSLTRLQQEDSAELSRSRHEVFWQLSWLW